MRQIYAFALLALALHAQTIPSPPPGSITVVASGATLTIGQRCSIADPCLYAVGTVVKAIVSPATATPTAGQNDTAYVYVDPISLNLMVGSTTAVTCSGCAAIAGITGFPSGSIMLAVVPIINGSWGAPQNCNVGQWAPATLSVGAGLTLACSGSACAIGVAGQ